MLGHNGRSTSIISVLTKDLTNLPEELLETTRCCSDRVFYNILLTFLDLGGTPGDSSMLLRPCILRYIINFSRSRRNYWRELDVAQTVYFTIYKQLSRVSEELLERARCCSDRAFYNIFITFSGIGAAPETARCSSDRVFYNISEIPRSWRSSQRPLDAAQTVHFTIYY